jgi:hypothetical protein
MCSVSSCNHSDETVIHHKQKLRVSCAIVSILKMPITEFTYQIYKFIISIPSFHEILNQNICCSTAHYRGGWTQKEFSQLISHKSKQPIIHLLPYHVSFPSFSCSRERACWAALCSLNK